MYRLPKQIEYKGILLPGLSVTVESLEKMKDLQTGENDIMVIGYPRSGNNWMCYAIYLIQAVTETITDPKHYLRNKFMIDFSSDGTYATSELKRALKSKSSRRIFMTHAFSHNVKRQILEEKCKTIYIVRNPKDMLVSYYHFYRSNAVMGHYKGTWNQFFDLYKGKTLAFGDWSDHVRDYLRYGHLPNIMFIRYEDAKSNLKKVLERMAEFMGKTLSDEQLNEIEEKLSITNMKLNDQVTLKHLQTVKEDTLLRKGNVGEWRQVLSPEQSNFVESNCQDLLRQLNYNIKSSL